MLDNFGGLLDWDNLQDWIQSQDIPGKGPVTAVEKLVGGSQNNLFLMTRGTEKFVMRRPDGSWLLQGDPPDAETLARRPSAGQQTDLMRPSRRFERGDPVPRVLPD